MSILKNLFKIHKAVVTKPYPYQRKALEKLSHALKWHVHYNVGMSMQESIESGDLVNRVWDKAESYQDYFEIISSKEVQAKMRSHMAESMMHGVYFGEDMRERFDKWVEKIFEPKVNPPTPEAPEVFWEEFHEKHNRYPVTEEKKFPHLSDVTEADQAFAWVYTGVVGFLVFLATTIAINLF